ncbi:carboxylesterase family protein [Phyllosticta capitalensis]|uniref:Carboxylesterase family protein n=1 Tax=Phyllosticta capitalensis TaxID=121624 RepID=A0ABR1YZ90_9PEZI
MWSACIWSLFVVFLNTGWVDGALACSNTTQELPIITLPYARVRASSYDEQFDIYTFKNIPFAAPPIGENRWRRPQPPVDNDALIDGSYGPSCIQGQNVVSRPGNSSTNSTTMMGPQSEDCLYLDMIVPGKAVRDPRSHRLPVVQYVYGGSYYVGSKGRNDGSGIVKSSGGNVIYVAANYRVGAYGFLAGDTMEKEATPNAGLHDIHAAFKWTRRHIRRVGGDKRRVSAWGESAGAGALFALLTAHGGTKNPLFKSAVLQSPAIDFAWDRRGTLETRFRQFADAAGCAGQGVECLRKASPEALVEANKAPAKAFPFTGRTPWAPAADGKFIRQMPRLEFMTGNYWKKLKALVVSHTADESKVFLDASVNNETRFNDYVDFFFPVPSVADKIKSRFTQLLPNEPLGRVAKIIEQGRINCNARLLVDHFATAGGNTSVYNMVYARGAGLHGSDVAPTFASPDPTRDVQGADVSYQSYLISLARSRDPNMFRAESCSAEPPTMEWKKVDAGETEAERYERVLRVVDGEYKMDVDETNVKDDCAFWSEVAGALTNVGGYAPPGAVAMQNLVPQGDASENFLNSDETCE